LGLSAPFIYLQPTHGYAELTPIDQGTTRALNISTFKKSAPRTSSFGTTADPDIARNQNEVPGCGMLARSGSKGSMTRIYAPRPYTPPTALLQGPITGSSGSEFKKPSLPFSNSKSIDEAAAGPGSIENIARQSASNSDAAVSDSFRPMTNRSHDEMGAAPAHRPSSRPSFFGTAQFPFDNVASNQDDSGYYSSVSEQTENEGDRLSIPVNAIRPAASGNDVQATRSLNVRAAPNADFDLSFANPTKRTRPASPADREDGILPTRSHELSKRPCVRRSPLRSHGSVSQAPLFENVSPGPQAFVLPPNVPHPSETMGDFPGLEFSEADLGHYAELYEKGTERWSRATMEEWLSGANDIMSKFTEIVDMVSLSFRSCLGPSG
jgi:hypothetical protein